MEILFFWQRLISNAWQAGAIDDFLIRGLGVFLLAAAALAPWLLLAAGVENWLLPFRSGRNLRWLLRLSLALSAAGLSGIFLGIGGLFQQRWLLVLYGVALIVAIGAWVLKLRVRKPPSEKANRRRLPLTPIWWLMIGGGLLVVPAVFYHATVFPILNWDSMHYDAPLAKYLYFHGQHAETVGRSLGFGMDTGYPPLHWATAAYFYELLDIPDDIFLRLLSPVSFVLLLMAGYEAGKMWGGRKLAALLTVFIMLTPVAAYGAFNANYNMMLGAWVALALLFVMRAEKSGRWSEWAMSGWFIGLAGLTSYNGYYPAVVLVAVALVTKIIQARRASLGATWSVLKKPLMMGALAFLLNMPWWARNIETFGTPWQPFLSPDPFVREINEERFNQNVSNIYKDIRYMGFGTDKPKVDRWLEVFFWSRSGIPAVSILALLGMFVIGGRVKYAAYPIVLAVTYWLSPLIQPAHTDRHAITYMASLGLLSALAVQAIVRQHNRGWLYNLNILVLVVVLLGNVSPLISLGHRYRLFSSKKTAWSWSQEPERWSKQSVLASEYSWGYRSWRYINEHLEPGRRVAMAGIPNYYVADGDAARLLFLDSKEALPLHGLSEPRAVRDFFKERNVQFIYAKGLNWYGFAYQGIKISDLLGGIDFPEVAPGVFLVRRSPQDV